MTLQTVAAILNSAWTLFLALLDQIPNFHYWVKLGPINLDLYGFIAPAIALTFIIWNVTRKDKEK